MNEELKLGVKEFKTALKDYESLNLSVEAHIKMLRASLYALKTVCGTTCKDNHLQLVEYQMLLYKYTMKIIKELEIIKDQFNQYICPFSAFHESLKQLLKTEPNSNRLYIEILRLITEKFNKANGLDVMSDSLFSTNVANFVVISLSRIATEAQKHVKSFDNHICELLFNNDGIVKKKLMKYDNPSQFTSFSKKTSNRKDYLRTCAFVESRSTHKQENIGSLKFESKESYNQNQMSGRKGGQNVLLRPSMSKENFFVKAPNHKREMSVGNLDNVRSSPRNRGLIKPIKEHSDYSKLDQTINMVRTPNKSSKKSDNQKRIHEGLRTNLLSSSNAKKDLYINSFKGHTPHQVPKRVQGYHEDAIGYLSGKLNYTAESNKDSKDVNDETIMEPYFRNFNDSLSPYRPHNNRPNFDGDAKLPRVESQKIVYSRTPIFLAPKKN